MKGSGMKRKRKAVMAAAAAAAALILFLWSLLSNYPVSLAVMKVYSGIHERESIMAEKGIQLNIPGGSATEETDWYPFVMTFNDSDGFRRFLRQTAQTGQNGQNGQSGQNGQAAQADYSDLELTILYNFPAFDVPRGCSRLYDISSPYYNGFYGAYLVSGQVTEGDGSRHPWGFTGDGRLDTASTALVPRFDFQNLVLGDMGIDRSRMVFQWELTSTEENVSYAGSDGWTRADAALTVNGVFHKKEEYHQSYLQYGPPGKYPEPEKMAERSDFAPVDMKGRVYGKYFPEWDTSVFFYVLAADEDVLERCDDGILSQSLLS